MWRSPLQKIAEKFRSIDLSSVGKIGAYSKAPWEELPLVVIPPRKQAILLAQQMQGPSAFTDASERNNLLGIGCHWNITGFAPISRTVAKGPDLSSYLGEFLAIEAALVQLLHSVNCGAIGPNVTVFSDSQGALRVLGSPKRPISYSQRLPTNTPNQRLWPNICVLSMESWSRQNPW